MAKRGKLEWVEALKQWRVRKQVNGKRQQWWLGAGTGWHDNAAYERAKAKWDEIKAEQNKATQQRQQQQQLLAMLALNQAADTGTPEQRTRALQAMAEALGADPATPHFAASWYAFLE